MAPTERYDKDVMGMPCFAADKPFWMFVGSNKKVRGVPGDHQNCPAALAIKELAGSPYVSVGRSRTDMALPHSKGVKKDGFGQTKWAVVRFTNSAKAKELVVAADTGTLGTEGVMITFLPTKKSLCPAKKKERNKQFRQPKGVKDGRGKRKDKTPDALTKMGVRTLQGQRNPK